MHLKEILPDELYYHSFTPASLPPGVATTWTEYYPHTTDAITVLLQEQRVKDGITFGPPPPPPKSPPPNPDFRRYPAATMVVSRILAT